MTIELQRDTQAELVESIKRYFSDNLDSEIGDLKATLMLEFCLKEIGPTIYNLAIADAQAHLQDRVADLENTCWEPEQTYWKDS